MKRSSLATQYYKKILSLEKDLNLAFKEIRVLQEKIRESDKMIAAQAKRIEELEEENRKLKGTGKKLKEIIFKEDKSSEEDSKRGATAGHKAFFRNKPRPEDVTEEKDVLLERCPNCENTLSLENLHKWNERYGIDIPLPIKPIITRYNVAQYHCKACGEWPQGQPGNLFGKSPFGINLIMLVLHMKYRGRAVDAHIQESLKVWYGTTLSGGGVHSILNRAAELFGAGYEAIKQAIRAGKVVYADETGWRVEGENWYAWAFVNDKVSLYTIETTRGGGVPKEVLKGFQGVLSTDWYQGYNSVDCEKQKCGVHFLRQTHAVATVENATEEAKTFHTNMVWFIRQARKKHKRCRTSEDRFELHSVMLKALSQFWKGRTYKDKEVEKIREWWLEKRGDELLTFLKYDYVEWENNTAERSIRPFVTRRKICGGSRSKRGAERESINMSCITTFIKQKKALLEAIPLAFHESLKENSKKVSFSLTC